LAAESRLSQKSWCALSIFDVSGGGNLSTDSSVRRQKRFQSALRKFQRYTGSLWAGTLSLGGIIKEGRRCDRGNFSCPQQFVLPSKPQKLATGLLYASLHFETCGFLTVFTSESANASNFSPHMIFAVSWH